VADVVNRNDRVDTLPTDIDKKAFGPSLRMRDSKRELAHSTFRLKSFSTVERLNHLYEDDTKIMDCEAT